jgi:hypothetical protein
MGSLIISQSACFNFYLDSVAEKTHCTMMMTLRYQYNIKKAKIIRSPVLAVLFCLSRPTCPVLYVLFWLSCSGCPFLAVVSRLSCPGCSLLAVLPCVSCPGNPVLAVLSWQSCPGYLDLPSQRENQEILKKRRRHLSSFSSNI